MKKGFTLIELLAVIIILAVIALIATPVVLNVVEEAKVKADRNSVYGLIDAAKLYFAESILDTDKKSDANGTTNVLDKLVISGEGPESGKIFINDKGQSAIAVVYGKVCFTKNFTDNNLTESNNIENCDIGIEETPVLPEDPTVDPEVPKEPEVSYKCKRATVLHTEECTTSATISGITYFCGGAGYVEGNKGTMIKYGNLGTVGTLISGDAFDCDVNGDGTYDATTERFYYVSDLYDTATKEFNNEYAILIYYNNITEAVAYDTSRENWHGPVTAITNLPTTSQWNNVSLSNTSRAIITETGVASTSGGILPTAFSYAGYSARLLTAQEVNKACGITIGTYAAGELDACDYLLENTAFTKGISSDGFLLENPVESDSNDVWMVAGHTRNVFSYSSALGADGSGSAVRPVIEVLKTDIEI